MLPGPYPFMLDTAAPQTTSRRSEYRWQRQDRIGRKPAHQFLGPGAGEITLSGEILPHFAGGYAQLDAMRLLAGRGRPLLLVSGRGDVPGDRVITEIAEENSEFFADGAPGVIGFTMTIAEYGRRQGRYQRPDGRDFGSPDHREVAMKYRTRDDDVPDLICHHYYGDGI